MTDILQYEDLEDATTRFFERHWNTSALGCDPPSWKGWHEFKGSVHNYELGGCYALFKGKELLYVGVGVSKGNKRYPEAGISRRLMSHILQIDHEKGYEWSRPRERWEGITSIYTIGFQKDLTYIALSLENFLIREFSGKLRNARV